MRIGLHALLTVALLCARPAIAVAEPISADAKERAGALDRQAREAFAEQDFEQAARQFEAAFRIAPHANTAFNAALAWDRAEQLAPAATSYVTALEIGGLNQQQERSARQRLEALNRQLGRVHLLSPIAGTVTLAHAERFPLPATIYVQPGEHSLLLERPDGSTLRKTIDVRAGEALTVRFTEKSPGLATATVTRDRPAKAAIAKPAAERENGTDGSSILGWSALGVGAALAGTAILLGVNAVDSRDEFVAGGQRDEELRERAIRLRTWTNVAAGAAAVAGALGVVLLVDFDGPDAAAVRVGVRSPH